MNIVEVILDSFRQQSKSISSLKIKEMADPLISVFESVNERVLTGKNINE
jgi:hypothetical protein